MKEIARRAAIEGGNVLMRSFGTALRIDRKGEVDLVTEADRAAEKAIVEVIRGTFPRHGILAEEGDYGRSDSSYLWIIDPLDGTTNYAHGFPWFAVSIALALEGKVILGIVYNPFHNEFFYAEQGKGAYLNEVQIRVSSTNHLDSSLLATGFPYDRRTNPVNNFDHFIRFQKRARACRRAGAASLDLAYTAAGRLDGYWEMKLKPWDVAAGKLLVEESGGKITDFDGAPFDIYGHECLASNDLIHHEMIDILQEGERP